MNIQLINPYNNKVLQSTPDGLTSDNKIVFPKKNGAYRIEENDNYSQNFGYQWNKFVGTQVDKASDLNMSKVRFFAETNWENEDLTNKNVLEVGSGAGRFSQIILDYTKANLYTLDYSNAVEANYKNNGPNERLHLFQASIYEMPFAPSQFDKVICFGVLQHTPDVEKSVKSLIDMVKPGGELVIDFYPVRGWWTKLHAKYILRPWTKKMTNEKLYKKIEGNIDWLIKAYRGLEKIGLGKLNRFLPICDIDGTLPKGLSKEQLREHCILDTFDMFSPEYDQPQKISTMVNWCKKYKLVNVSGEFVKYENCVAPVVKGTKPFS